MREVKIVQRDSEPARRFFSDDKHFDLTVWYNDGTLFKVIAGFQLSYKPNPFNTDNEYFITCLPDGKNQIRLGKIASEDHNYPAPKQIQTTQELPPLTFFQKLPPALESLPTEIRTYIEERLKPIRENNTF